MSGGAHGLQPDGHEHVRCRFCYRTDVHVVQGAFDSHAAPIYAAHAVVAGGTEPCRRSRAQAVLPQDRHQPAPEQR